MFHCDECGAVTPDECAKRHAARERDLNALARAEEALEAIKDARVATDHGQLVPYLDAAETGMRGYIQDLTRIVDAEAKS